MGEAKPEALELAEWIEGDMTCQGDDRIAACLRTQHAEIESLRAQVEALRADGERLDREAATERALQRAAKELPDGWGIYVEVERNSGLVSLLCEGYEFDYPDQCEGIASSINAAIDAQKQEGG